MLNEIDAWFEVRVFAPLREVSASVCVALADTEDSRSPFPEGFSFLDASFPPAPGGAVQPRRQIALPVRVFRAPRGFLGRQAARTGL